MSENIQNTENNKSQKSNDIDLGDLFRMIGRALNKLFVFLRTTFLIILDLFIRALIVMRAHVVKFIIVGLLSVATGWFIDSRQPLLYGANMTIRVNFDSARQLYSNIRYYNELAIDKDSVRLGEIFNMESNVASKLRGLHIEPSLTEIEMLKSYTDFMKQADTVFIKNEMNYDIFKENINPLDFRIHYIRLISSDKSIFEGMQERLISYNVENNYIKNLRETTIKNLEDKKKFYENRFNTIDTLREVYNVAIKTEAKKTSNSQTSIQMAASSVQTNELELFKLDAETTAVLGTINVDIEDKKNTINVLSDLTSGAIFKNFFDKYIFRVPVVTLLLLLLFILLRELNKYLNTYAENKRLYA